MRISSSNGNRVRSVLTCCAVAANAICGGGVYSFALIVPALVEHLKLTQPQLTAIALAGMVGQYIFAAVVGITLDRYGAWSCSLIASVLYSLGFGLFARQVAHTPSELSHVSENSFRILVFSFGMIGLATVFSYFALVFTATKTFPQYIGIASGTSMSIFGLSPLFLSFVASSFFTPQGQTLDVTSYFTFMAVLTGTVHLVSALVFRANRAQIGEAAKVSPAAAIPSGETEPSEASEGEVEPLLPDNSPKDTANVHIVPVQAPQEGSALDLFKDSSFWILAFWMTLVVGASEMVVSNLGSIVLSLPAAGASDATANIAHEVRLLSFFNTLSRLLVGPLADALAPVAARLDGGIWAFARKRRASRVAFLLATSLLLSATFVWLELGVKTQEAVWPLSVGTGIAYGSTFTVLPGILSSIWGFSNLGRNFGIISYTPFVGTSMFSYLYAAIASRHVAPDESACTGVECWQATFWISTATSIAACCAAFILWRRWRSRV